MAKLADSSSGQNMIPEEWISILLVAIGITTISNTQYDMMSALDGTRTASGFQHKFRSILAKARDLKAKIDAGEKFTPVQPSRKSSELGVPATPRKRKIAADSEVEGASKKKRNGDAKVRGKKKRNGDTKVRGKKAKAKAEGIKVEDKEETAVGRDNMAKEDIKKEETAESDADEKDMDEVIKEFLNVEHPWESYI